ncbi:hypothetical protein VEE28_10180 [Escherichia coli]|nr:hypothetical protein VEE28_10180 [Escherichia coli]
MSASVTVNVTDLPSISAEYTPFPLPSAAVVVVNSTPLNVNLSFCALFLAAAASAVASIPVPAMFVSDLVVSEPSAALTKISFPVVSLTAPLSTLTDLPPRLDTTLS